MNKSRSLIIAGILISLIVILSGSYILFFRDSGNSETKNDNANSNIVEDQSQDNDTPPAPSEHKIVVDQDLDSKCYLEVDEEACPGFYPAYYYDQNAEKCRFYLTGSCEQNPAPFENKEDCVNTCGEDPAHLYACKNDSDCMIVSGTEENICGCSAGGKQTAININHKDYWDANFTSFGGTAILRCTRVESTDPSCNENNVARCVNDKCTLIEERKN